MLSEEKAIGVFDSGVGGISTLRVLAKLLPEENFIFYGDSKNAPYGDKSATEVYRLAKQNVEVLLKEKVKAVVIACNTATSAAKVQLVKNYPELPILGIEPALKEAIDHHAHHILVMGTGLTLNLPKYQAQVQRFSDQAQIQSLPCPGLADLIEQGAANLPAIRQRLGELLQPLKQDEFDAVVLGCTHYPFVAQQIMEELHYDAPIYTGFEGLARNLQDHLRKQNLLRTTNPKREIQFLSSRDTADEIQLYQQLFTKGINYK